MSTLSVTTVQTANGTTDLTLKTGNSSNPSIVVSSAFGSLTVGSNTFNGTAFTGFSNNQSAIAGYSNTGVGFYGQSTSGAGIQGNSNTSSGIVGQSLGSGTGASLYSNTGVGLYAQSNTGAIAQFANATATIATVTQAGMNVQTNTFNLGVSSLVANNGYSRLPNGLLMQWGTASANNSTAGNITFPVPFTSVYSVSVAGNGAAAFINGVNSTVIQCRISGAATNIVYWTVIGV